MNLFDERVRYAKWSSLVEEFALEVEDRIDLILAVFAQIINRRIANKAITVNGYVI